MKERMKPFIKRIPFADIRPDHYGNRGEWFVYASIRGDPANVAKMVFRCETYQDAKIFWREKVLDYERYKSIMMDGGWPDAFAASNPKYAHLAVLTFNAPVP